MIKSEIIKCLYIDSILLLLFKNNLMSNQAEKIPTQAEQKSIIDWTKLSDDEETEAIA